MDVKQIYAIVNDVRDQVLGVKDVAITDLQGIVETGTEVFNANQVDNWTKALVNRIGREIFVARKYSGGAPSVLMDNWEFGSVLMKVSGDLYDTEKNDSWDLKDKQNYPQDVFHKPKVSVKFFNGKTTFSVKISVAEIQVKESFTSLEKMNSFISMIFTDIDNTLQVDVDNLVMLTIDNFIGETIFEDYKVNTGTEQEPVYTLGDLGSKSGVRAINVLYLYNQEFGKNLKVAQAWYDPDFLKFFASLQFKYVGYLKKMSRLHNIGGKARFTPNDRLHYVILSDIKANANAYLQADTFNDEYTKLPNAEEVSFWQGSGSLTSAFSKDKMSAINIVTSNNHTINTSGILSVMFDRDALGVLCKDKRVKSHVTELEEFTTYKYIEDGEYFNDFNENFIVFFMADDTTSETDTTQEVVNG